MCGTIVSSGRGELRAASFDSEMVNACGSQFFAMSAKVTLPQLSRPVVGYFFSFRRDWLRKSEISEILLLDGFARNSIPFSRVLYISSPVFAT